MTTFSLNIRGRLRRFDRPVIMGIINITDDSFYSASRATAEADIAERARKMVSEGAEILDLGACSTRPGAKVVDAAEEGRRLASALKIVREAVGLGCLISVDTFRADVARMAVEECGADIINDISGGDLDAQMAATIARLKVPYIIQHTRGTPATMHTMTDYGSEGVCATVVTELARKAEALHYMGIADLIADPGFGFAKTVEQNYAMLANLAEMIEAIALPVLVGLSRKTMFYKPLGCTPADVLPATTAANTLALQAGAAMLRVHDVAAAVQAREVCRLTEENCKTC